MSEYGKFKSRKGREPRKSIVVPLNPGEEIEIRFYEEDKSKIPKSWFLTAEELHNILKTGRRS